MPGSRAPAAGSTRGRDSTGRLSEPGGGGTRSFGMGSPKNRSVGAGHGNHGQIQGHREATATCSQRKNQGTASNKGKGKEVKEKAI